jgi:protein-S-isoprenylcysteine O-methyltransferase Ste14
MFAQKSIPFKSILHRIFQAILGIGIMCTFLFIPAGTLKWWAAWILIGIYFFAVYVGVAFLQIKDPQLVKQRHQVNKDVKSWDKIIVTRFSLVFLPLTLITSGLDYRFSWSSSFPVALQSLALTAGILSFVSAFWGISSNTHFESYVRIQDDQDHKTISTGPYQYVRHPGYAGMALSVLTIPLTLGSWWARIPGGIAAILIVMCTVVEDRTLQAALEGYYECTKQVRFRLIPGIWLQSVPVTEHRPRYPGFGHLVTFSPCHKHQHYTGIIFASSVFTKLSKFATL